MSSETLSTPVIQYFANAAGGVHFLPNAFVYVHWSGSPMTMAEFCALYIHARNLLRRNNLRRILGDHRLMPPITEEQRHWLVQEWLPETITETGYERCAVLRSPHHERLHTPEVIAELKRQVAIEFFDDVLTAAAWLRQP